MKKKFVVNAYKNGKIVESAKEDLYEEAYEYYYEFAWRSKYGEFDRVELINTQVNKNKKTQLEPAMFLVEELPF